MKDFKIYLIAIAIFLAVAAMVQMCKTTTKAEVEATVSDKERITYKSGESIKSKYLIFTDVETFECTDALMYWKFNSSDMYGKIERGKKYRFTVYGWRIPFFSSYRNIINVQNQK